MVNRKMNDGGSDVCCLFCPIEKSKDGVSAFEVGCSILQTFRERRNSTLLTYSIGKEKESRRKGRKKER